MPSGIPTTALKVHAIRLHDWTLADLTLDNILAERARELAYENFRRQDLIHFGKFGEARTPDKTADPADGHLNLFPIPDQQRTANPNLVQNTVIK